MHSAEPDRPHRLPRYLVNTYSWAYLRPRSIRLLDHNFVVNLILWGQSRQLIGAVVNRLQPNTRVLQAACVYGDFSKNILTRIGALGALQVIDVAPIQLANLRAKLQGQTNVTFHLEDLTHPVIGSFNRDSCDAACCFFLLHEMPNELRMPALRNLIGALKPGGKLIVTDYHRPAEWHPLRWIMALVFIFLEPYAQSLVDISIESLLPKDAMYLLEKRLFFAGLYQMVVITKQP